MNREFISLPLVVILVVIIIGGVGYWAWTQTPVTEENTSSVTASPTSGTAPMSVNFKVSATDSSDDSGIYYTIVFGDSEAAGFPRTSSPSLSHVYAASGTYTAVVTRMTQCSSWECIGPSTEVGTVAITVK